MDIAQSPDMDEALKKPLVDLDEVESGAADPEHGAANTFTDEALKDLASPSHDGDEGSEISGDEWETDSIYEEALHFVRDDQLSSVPDSCTPQEAAAYRKRLHEIGKVEFVEETIQQKTITAKKLLTAFGIVPPSFLEDAPDEAYHPLLGLVISREYAKRQKLEEYNTIQDAVELLEKSKNIIVITGAGISTSLGIPDFRSKDTGLYSRLEHLGLSDPQEVFDIQLFYEDPSIFFSVAKDILPTEKKFSPTHAFIKLLQDKGKLLTNYTQNIDNIEANAGVSREKIVQCHGSFATATCTKCAFKVPGDAIFDTVKAGNIPECKACKDRLALQPPGMKRKRSSNGSHPNRKKDLLGDDSEDDDYDIPTPGVMKPDITFFGEDLPDEFGRRLVQEDRELADLVIVIGTSMKVAPVADVPSIIPSTVPQIYISRTANVEANMECVIRFAQIHETFRRAEIEALATLAGVDVEFLWYDSHSPFCLAKFPDGEAARKVVSRSILAQEVYELWGRGASHAELLADIRSRTESRWKDYEYVSVHMILDSFGRKRSQAEKLKLFQNFFEFCALKGRIDMNNAQEEFAILEDHVTEREVIHMRKSAGAQQASESAQQGDTLKMAFFGRLICQSSREMVGKYDLKKRKYIATTSMDAELSLVTANMALAAPGKIFFDPFVGTGSFLLAAAYFGAMTLGADIDGRSFKGKRPITKENPPGLYTNFAQYGTERNFLNAFTSDLTNTPIREVPFLDGIVCDPPYGIREGLRVLGSRDGRESTPVYIDGKPAHTLPGFIAPKKPYGFVRLQQDILCFAARTLVEGGRIAMWMPTTDDQEIELMIPTNPSLEIVSVSVQHFRGWARRLLTYRKLPAGEVSLDTRIHRATDDLHGVTADDLNEFRRKYFMPKEEKLKRAQTQEASNPTTEN
ncbi:NAD-dependent histone deacetylase SIR2 [Talaromyces islandicus]|uniref:tRNA (guanine(10)-N(2))-methyltransferase n=1 Tax=Talaromyces islandicus TaxID=28573 RepID=A0A0U1LNV6_TALIS|nr:NAD-dependent histone deacetylase SIR2 [Talaromyces islandicus]